MNYLGGTASAMTTQIDTPGGLAYVIYNICLHGQ